LLQVGSYWALIDSESEEEKETENDTLITSKEISDSKNITKKSVKKKKVCIEHLFFLYFLSIIVMIYKNLIMTGI